MAHGHRLSLALRRARCRCRSGLLFHAGRARRIRGGGGRSWRFATGDTRQQTEDRRDLNKGWNHLFVTYPIAIERQWQKLSVVPSVLTKCSERVARQARSAGVAHATKAIAINNTAIHRSATASPPAFPYATFRSSGQATAGTAAHDRYPQQAEPFAANNTEDGTLRCAERQADCDFVTPLRD